MSICIGMRAFSKKARRVPRIEQQRTLEQETTAMRRLRQAVEQPFETEMLQYFLKWPMARFRLIRKACANGSGKIGCHVTASR